MSSISVSFLLFFLEKIFNNLLDSSCRFFFFIAPSESVLCVGIIGIIGGLLGLGLCEAFNLSLSKNVCELDCKDLDLELTVR